MHYHMEVVMPPTKDIQGDLTKILTPFDENNEDANHPFFDWFQIGGRYSGRKTESTIPAEKLAEFNNWLQAEGVTVSSIQFGKQELQPASQIPKIDAKWKEMFGTAPCTMFRHSNSNSKTLPGDVCTLSEVDDTECYRVLIAGPSYDGTTLTASLLVATSEWNGVNYIDTKWDGKLRSAIAMLDTLHWSEEWKASHTPKDDWLVVTVDYHN